jgi:predicted phosphodiesterase
MKILSVSDVVVPSLYSTEIARLYREIDLVISCGDLPFSYLEYINSLLNKRLYYVHGNHAPSIRYGYTQSPASAAGGTNLHRRVCKDESGLIIAGIEGCLLYNQGPYQYSQSDMWWMVWKLVPTLLLNKILNNRYLDIFITHASPWKIHDEEDLTHQGIKAFRWLNSVFKPAVHIHGHIHVYNVNTITETLFKDTWVINTYGHRIMEIDVDALKKCQKLNIEDVLGCSPRNKYLTVQGND